jgi:hypothetical protein
MRSILGKKTKDFIFQTIIQPMKQEDIESWGKMVKSKDSYEGYYSWGTRHELKRDREAGPPEDLNIWRWSTLHPSNSLR